MHRAAFFAAGLVLTLHTGAWAQDARKSSGSRGSSSAAVPEKQGSADRAGARKAKSRQPEKPAVEGAAIARVHQTRQVFRFAVESCERSPDRCDKTLRDDAERRFLDACGSCAPSERCTVDRDAIRAGTAKSTGNPCVTR